MAVTLRFYPALPKPRADEVPPGYFTATPWTRMTRIITLSEG